MAMMIPKELAQRLGDGAHIYAAQRAYVALMFDVMGRFLVSGSASDSEIMHEMEGFPEGLVLGFSVLGDKLAMRLACRNGRFAHAASDAKPDLEIIFKHIAHAFLVLSFQESTPRAFANQRMLSQGDTALSMRFTRCLNRVQAISLPKFVASRALKSTPNLSLAQKLSLATQLYAGVVRGFVSRSKP